MNSLQRDTAHARDFLARHRDKLMFGSDCDDRSGFGPVCSGSDAIIMIKRLSATKEIFMDGLDAIHPRYGVTIRMALE